MKKLFTPTPLVSLALLLAGLAHFDHPAAQAQTGQAHAAPAASKTRTHIETLASARFDGRLTGTPGERLAGDYIVSELRRIGAKPLPGANDFRLPFAFTAGTRDGGTTISPSFPSPSSRAAGAAPRVHPP